MDNISKNTNVSKTSLYKYFRQNFACTVSEYINKKRIEKSVEYLTGTNLSIEEISQKTGFTNAHNAGVFVAVSAGNKAKGFYENAPLTKNIDYSALGLPAGTPGIITVASADKSSYKISHFSSFGVNETLELKPEITAPGSNIVSSVKNKNVLL